MRLEYPAGERMFVDFAGDTVPVTDAESGRTWQAHVFVSVLWNQKSTELSTAGAHIRWGVAWIVIRATSVCGCSQSCQRDEAP